MQCTIRSRCPPLARRSRFSRARRGKRRVFEVARFERRFESNLIDLERALRSRSWEPSGYRHFEVVESKRRKISAAPFEDRIVQMAVHQVVEPVFERIFIPDSYSARPGKGTHRALVRLAQFLRRGDSLYALKGDVSKFYPTIDHGRIKELVARRIGDPDVLWLLGKIVDSYRTPYQEAATFEGREFVPDPGRPMGVPIGNVTSQLFANLALDPLDQFVKRALRQRFYVRYADDIAILGKDVRALAEVRSAIREFLLVADRLILPLDKAPIVPVQCGVPFLGFVSFPGYRLLAKRPGMRFRKRLGRMARLLRAGRLSREDLDRRIRSWISHASFGKTYHLRRALFDRLGTD